MSAICVQCHTHLQLESSPPLLIQDVIFLSLILKQISIKWSAGRKELSDCRREGGSYLPVGGRKLSACGREGVIRLWEGGSYLTVGGRKLSHCGREGVI